MNIRRISSSSERILVRKFPDETPNYLKNLLSVDFYRGGTRSNRFVTVGASVIRAKLRNDEGFIIS